MNTSIFNRSLLPARIFCATVATPLTPHPSPLTTPLRTPLHATVCRSICIYGIPPGTDSSDMVYGLWATGPPTIISGTLDMQTYNGFEYIWCVCGVCVCVWCVCGVCMHMSAIQCRQYRIYTNVHTYMARPVVIQLNSLLCRCSHFHILRPAAPKGPFVLFQRWSEKSTERKCVQLLMTFKSLPVHMLIMGTLNILIKYILIIID